MHKNANRFYERILKAVTRTASALFFRCGRPDCNFVIWRRKKVVEVDSRFSLPRFAIFSSSAYEIFLFVKVPTGVSLITDVFFY